MRSASWKSSQMWEVGEIQTGSLHAHINQDEGFMKRRVRKKTVKKNPALFSKTEESQN